MEHISIREPTASGGVVDRIITAEKKTKKKVTTSITQYGGIILSAFITIVTIVLVTTDFRLLAKGDIIYLGLDFFLLMFCSYTVYISCADSGRSAGLRTDIYDKWVVRYDLLKATVFNHHYQEALIRFCKQYVQNELKTARENELVLTAISYDLYLEKYLNKDKNDIEADESLSESEKKAIIRANRLKPVELDTKMLLRRGRSSTRRQPLEISPETKRAINYGVKLAGTFFIALFLSLLIIDVAVSPTWSVIATVFSKLLTIGINAFQGYKFGYQNIVVDTVNYMNDQCDLLEQGIQYAETEKKAA